MPDYVEVVSGVITNNLQELKNISHNVANLNTPGFLARSGKGGEAFMKVLNEGGAQTQDVYSTRMVAPQITGKSNHVAVTGNGWFLVEGRDKKFYITRNGSLNIDEEGYLAISSGDRVVGVSGLINIGDKHDIDIDNRGVITSAGEHVDQFVVVSIQEHAPLEHVGGGRYSVLVEGMINDAEPGRYSVISGALNSSNVDSVAEVTRMTTLMRQTELLQKALVTYGEIVETGINNIGK